MALPPENLKQQVAALEAELQNLQTAYRKIQIDYRQLTDLFLTSRDLIIITDTNGIITRINPACRDILGYSDDELIGKPVLSITVAKGTYLCSTGEHIEIDDAYLQQKAGEYAAFQKSGSASLVRSFYVHKTGTAVPVEQNITFLKNARDQKAGSVAIARDITAQMQTLKALQKSEERFRLFFEYAPDAIYLSDIDGTFIDGNAAAEKLVGYHKEELIGSNYFELNILSPDQMPRALELLEKNCDGLATGPDEFVLTRKNGSTVPVEIRTYPFDIQGKQRVLGITRDISERYQAEIRIREAYDRLEQTVQERTRDLEEANTALRVMIQHRDNDRSALEDTMLQNIRDLIQPYVKKLHDADLPEQLAAQVALLESNLQNIISPLMRNLSLKHLELTKTETEIALLIKDGKRTGDISALLNLSKRTVEFHRSNIRRKCGLNNKKMNLRTFLLSLA